MDDAMLAYPISGRVRGAWRRSSRELVERLLPSALSALHGILWSLASVLIALGVWQLVCLTVSPDFPTPLASFRVLVELLGSAFTTVNGTRGIGYQVVASMKRIAIGFSLSAAVAIPVGI